MFLVFWVILVPSEIDVFDEVGSNCWFSQINSDTWLYPLIHLIIPVPCVQNFKAPDSEEGEASEGMEPSPSRSSRYTGLITTLVKHDHDPLQKVNYKTRAAPQGRRGAGGYREMLQGRAGSRARCGLVRGAGGGGGRSKRRPTASTAQMRPGAAAGDARAGTRQSRADGAAWRGVRPTQSQAPQSHTATCGYDRGGPQPGRAIRQAVEAEGRTRRGRLRAGAPRG